MAQIIAHVKLEQEDREMLTYVNRELATMVSNITEFGSTLKDIKTGEIMECSDLQIVIDIINTLLKDTQWEIIE